MIILGIDPALSKTGYGLIREENGRFFLIKTGLIMTDSAKSYSLRLNEIYSHLLKVINKFHPEVMVVEKFYVHLRHPTTAYILGQIKGIICLLSAQKNIPLFEYASTRVKKSILGIGQASKYQIERMVMQLLNLKETPQYNDITDALAVALAHCYILRSQAVISKRCGGLLV
jgi:crossover junction endodeoxyribonuclease RuvC